MIDTDLKLNELLPVLEKTPWIALDTEADSLHAYPEKICLIQISVPGRDELIDPLAGIQLEPLLQTLRGHELIMHGSDYDLRLFRKHYNFVPSAVFDTMLAARLLGIAQFGLNHLLGQYLQVILDKGSQKADWARRPLTERMEEYARNDTHYLKSLSDKLKVELEAKGRLGWQQESCARLIADCAELATVDENLVWRIKGASGIGPAELAVLREIWRWREAEATAANKPPYFILRHEALIDLAIGAVTGRPIHPFIPPKFSDRRRAELLAAIERGLAVPAREQPLPVRHSVRRISDSAKHQVIEIQKRRDARATELGIDPTLIASRATMLDLAENWTANEKNLMNWQRELLK